MANHASHASLPYPIRGARYTLLIPYLDGDGDPTDPTTPDTEISKDDAAATDTAEEVATPKNSVGMLTLTGMETDCSCAGIAAKASSGPKTTLATIYPRALVSIGTGTLSAGSSGGGTLGTILAYDVSGCFIKTTGGSGGGGTGGANNQARKIMTYNVGSGVFTVTPNWETAADNTTTYEILLPDGLTVGMLKALNPTTAGRTLSVESDGMAHSDIKEWLGTAVATPTVGGVPEVDVTHFGGTAGAFVSGIPAVIAAGIGNGAITAVSLASDVLALLGVIGYGTAQAVGSTSIQFASGTTFENDVIIGATVVIISASTGAGQSTRVTDYTGSNDTATVDWPVGQPTGTVTYVIFATPQD